MKCEILKYKDWNIFLRIIFYMWYLAITHEIIISNVSFSVSENDIITVIMPIMDDGILSLPS